jgi:hypothetical protein
MNSAFGSRQERIEALRTLAIDAPQVRIRMHALSHPIMYKICECVCVYANTANARHRCLAGNDFFHMLSKTWRQKLAHPRTAHVARMTAHVARMTAHVARMTAHVARMTAHVARMTVHPAGYLLGSTSFAIRGPTRGAWRRDLRRRDANNSTDWSLGRHCNQRRTRRWNFPAQEASERQCVARDAGWYGRQVIYGSFAEFLGCQVLIYVFVCVCDLFVFVIFGMNMLIGACVL